MCYQVTCATRCAVLCCCKATRSALVYFKFAECLRLAELKCFLAVWGARARASLEVPGSIWVARVNLGCQGQSGACQGQSGACQGQSGVPEAIWNARASLGCQFQMPSQCGLPPYRRFLTKQMQKFRQTGKLPPANFYLASIGSVDGKRRTVVGGARVVSGAEKKSI